MPMEMGDLAASVCLKQIVGRYFFQMNCFLDQLSMLQGERGENHNALLSQESIYTTAALTTSLVLLLGSVRCKEQIEQAFVSQSHELSHDMLNMKEQIKAIE